MQVTLMDWEQNDYILIIEDDDGVGQGLTEVLQDNGHRVVSFEDGRMALDYLQQKSILPRLILLDSARPGTKGREFLLERRKDARIASVPVVDISGDSEASIEPAPSTTSLSHMLRRPVSVDAILGAVARWAPAPVEA
jgi:CheY-like chemotaxis protein